MDSRFRGNDRNLSNLIHKLGDVFDRLSQGHGAPCPYGRFSISIHKNAVAPKHPGKCDWIANTGTV